MYIYIYIYIYVLGGVGMTVIHRYLGIGRVHGGDNGNVYGCWGIGVGGWGGGWGGCIIVYNKKEITLVMDT
jgi:hypothetical protein